MRGGVFFLSFILFLLALHPISPAEVDLSPEYATRYSVERDGDVTILSVLEPWPGGEPIRYALVPRGSGLSRPGVEATIEVPVRTVVSLSSTYIPHLDSLELLDRLVGVDRRSYIYNQEVRRRIDDGEILEVGDIDSLDMERLLAARPEMIMASALSEEDLLRLSRPGFPVVVNADWLETSPLGRAEWIRFLSLFFEKSEEAQRIHQRIAAEYEETRNRLAQATERPTLLANAPYRGEWAVPAGESYLATLFEDAGADYLWSETEGTGSVFRSLEEVFARAREAEFWVNLGFRWSSREDVRAVDPRLAEFRAFHEGSMYHYNRRVRPGGANDFWESGAARPDIVLADLGRIFHPELLGDHELYYYRRIE